MSCALGAGCEHITRAETVFELDEPMRVACLTDVFAGFESSGEFTELREFRSPGETQDFAFVAPDVKVYVVVTGDTEPQLRLYYAWKGREPKRAEVRHAEALSSLANSIKRNCAAAAGMTIVSDTCTARVCPDHSRLQ